MNSVRSATPRSSRRKSEPYKRRSFGHVKDMSLSSLGLTSLGNTKGQIMMVLVKILAALMCVVFVMFHPLYLKTGVPMFKYGFSMMVLPPFYLLWAIWKLLSVYLLGMAK